MRNKPITFERLCTWPSGDVRLVSVYNSTWAQHNISWFPNVRTSEVLITWAESRDPLDDQDALANPDNGVELVSIVPISWLHESP